MRIPELAFLGSGIVVLGSLAISATLQQPDLPGMVLVTTGWAASFLSVRLWHQRRFQILVALVVLNTAMGVLHPVFHRLGIPHDWLGPFYVVALLAYCGLAISLGHRLLPIRAVGNE